MAPMKSSHQSAVSHSKNRSQRPPTLLSQKLTQENIADLKVKLTQLLEGKEPRDFQVRLTVAQEERRDVLCQAATGMGKTVIAAAPYVWEHNATKVTIMVSPLIGLQDEMAQTFVNEFKLTAVAVSSAHGGCTADVMRDIVNGRYRIVLISPEMLVSRPFVNGVLRHTIFATRVYAVVVDEAHCISHWGDSFRKKYGTIGSIRVFLPRNIPFIAVSATLTRRVVRDIKTKLQFTRSDFTYENIGNDRPNVSLIVRAIHNTIKSYSDLDFVIPEQISQHADIKKTWIYADNISVGSEIIDYIHTKLPPRFHSTIRPYNALLTHDYRQKAMEDFRTGLIRILVCTDAAGMGCNVSDVDMVVQWKLPATLSSFVQRAGRAARGYGRQGVAILLVEPTAYTTRPATDIIPSAPSSREKRNQKGKKTQIASSGNQESKTRKRTIEKDYARDHGRYRGGRDQDDFIALQDSSVQSQALAGIHTAKDEGLLHFVQAQSCRRDILCKVFDNPVPRPTVACCDICSPSLLNLTRPGVRIKPTRQPRLDRRESPRQALVDELVRWRQDVLAKDPQLSYCSYLSASSILPDEAISALASMKKLDAVTAQRYLEPQWSLWPRYSKELLSVLAKFETTVESKRDTGSNAGTQLEPSRIQSLETLPSQKQEPVELAEPPCNREQRHGAGTKRALSPSFYMPERITRRWRDERDNQTAASLPSQYFTETVTSDSASHSTSLTTTVPLPNPDHHYIKDSAYSATALMSVASDLSPQSAYPAHPSPYSTQSLPLASQFSSHLDSHAVYTAPNYASSQRRYPTAELTYHDSPGSISLPFPAQTAGCTSSSQMLNMESSWMSPNMSVMPSSSWSQLHHVSEWETPPYHSFSPSISPEQSRALDYNSYPYNTPLRSHEPSHVPSGQYTSMPGIPLDDYLSQSYNSQW